MRGALTVLVACGDDGPGGTVAEAATKLGEVDSADMALSITFSSDDSGPVGFGVSGVKVEELYREIRALRIYEGATEVQKIRQSACYSASFPRFAVLPRQPPSQHHHRMWIARGVRHIPPLLFGFLLWILEYLEIPALSRGLQDLFAQMPVALWRFQ